MQYDRPIVNSVAGFDPSGGAGVLADVKTFEQHNCLGMGVVSSLTVQTEKQFISVEWLAASGIISQIRPLLDEYGCEVIKIGLIENVETLLAVIDFIHASNPNIKIIWDPVLVSGTGFTLIPSVNKNDLAQALKKLYLITPNIPEVLKLSGEPDEKTAAAQLAAHCRVLLKGGHSDTEPGRDFLFTAEGITALDPCPGDYYSKHGSGCILSSAIAANLANGKPDLESCIAAKQYIEKILRSNPNLLAYHV